MPEVETEHGESIMGGAADVAVLLLGHGSRAPDANDGMYQVLETLRQKGQYRIVEVGFMGLNRPTIEEGARACVAQGARVVFMIPYFLHSGIHLQEDLPRVMQLLQLRYPGVRFAMAEPLGFHPKLVDIIIDRVGACYNLTAGSETSSDEAPECDAPRGSVKGLRTGFTTGACAAAATKAAVQALLSGQPVSQVDLMLPTGQRALFQVARCEVGGDFATSVIVKDGGDDPDATNGAEIHSFVAWVDEPGVTLKGGPGVGVVTKPGLELAVGEPAINPVPRQMIRAAVAEVVGQVAGLRGVSVVISVPRGEQIARKTLNQRLGIVGGISILGTTGIVVPFSTAAYTATISQSLGVAKAMGCREVVLTTGRRSERFAQAIMDLPEEAFVQMGDFAGFALEECSRRGFTRLTIVAMIGKLSKLAAGHLQTHVSKSSLGASFLAGIAKDCGALPALVGEISKANTARHVAQIAGENGLNVVFQRLCQMAAGHCAAHAGGGLCVTCILTDFDGVVMARASVER